jgi:siroheme synthase
LPDQRIEIGTLDTLEAMIRNREIEGPALILIGEVVSLAAAAALADAVPLQAAG